MVRLGERLERPLRLAPLRAQQPAIPQFSSGSQWLTPILPSSKSRSNCGSGDCEAVARSRVAGREMLADDEEQAHDDRIREQLALSTRPGLDKLY